MRHAAVAVCCALIAASGAQSPAPAQDVDFAFREFVPNAPTATAIARAVLIPIYGLVIAFKWSMRYAVLPERTWPQRVEPEAAPA